MPLRSSRYQVESTMAHAPNLSLRTVMVNPAGCVVYPRTEPLGHWRSVRPLPLASKLSTTHETGVGRDFGTAHLHLIRSA